ncbi:MULTISPECIES: prolyl oligopeptidase family serine peptidase [Roseobacteraceae]|uniref:Peptidase S9 prolyl oligopeptidase catalytic domain-containing protein n=1 Tax=Pseudosulfitobacter pseudonitzschiae TaxID=1402135 RepID=A0A221K7S0_9RHOB|nr:MULTISPECIES: prolyl oligopeptidase family serine peptidase [Roseobacteraceae]ASM75051.1 hypothetical protein SULPSESMR1_04325 [Pseudosulfitobacter pseudonitzschiae]
MLAGKSKLIAVAAIVLVGGAGYGVWDRYGAASGFGGGVNKSEDAALQTMIVDVLPKFRQFEYTDAETGLTVPYNLFVPDSHDGAKPLPLVYFIADSSVSGQDVTAPLSQGYGGLIWATDADQEKHPSMVLVPEFPEVILDDHGSYSMTDYVELAARLVETVAHEQGADMDRLYATGQSMGGMTLLYLSAKYPDLFAAQMFVSSQWDITTLAGLGDATFFYVVAAGDAKASAGQQELYDLLTINGADISRATDWDANWDDATMNAAVDALLDEGNRINFAMFAEGTVMPEGVATPQGSGEHMYSFDPAYSISAIRDWLFAQSKS